MMLSGRNLKRSRNIATVTFFQVLSVFPLAEHHPSMGFALLVAVAAVPNGRPKTGAARGRQYQPTVIGALMIFLSRILELVPLRLNRRDQPMLAQQMCQPPVIPLPNVEFDPSTHPIFRPAPHVVFLEEWLASSQGLSSLPCGGDSVSMTSSLPTASVRPPAASIIALELRKDPFKLPWLQRNEDGDDDAYKSYILYITANIHASTLAIAIAKKVILAIIIAFFS